jgi:hypothetical protein
MPVYHITYLTIFTRFLPLSYNYHQQDEVSDFCDELFFLLVKKTIF